MKTHQIIILLAMLVFTSLPAQVKLSDYKYVIVEKQFHFQREADEYNLNRLVQYLFRKHGFIAILEGETFPDDLISNFCLALNSEVTVKGLIRTRATVTLKDCRNNIVHVSPEGITKVKEFDRAYEMAIRDAFESFENLNYEYVPSERITQYAAPVETTEKFEKAEKEIAELKEEISVLKTQQAKAEPEKEVSTEEDKAEPKESLDLSEEIEVYEVKSNTNALEKEVIDKDGRTIMILLATAKEDVFLVKDKNALVFKDSNKWFHSEIRGGQQLLTELRLSF